MNWTKPTLGFLFLGLFTVTSQALDGGMTGGGGDEIEPTQGSAWFLGGTPIKACVQISRDFGLSPKDALIELKKSFKTWAEYIREKKIHADAPEKFRLTTDLDLAEKCIGDEELVFLLGVSTSESEIVRKEHHNPVGFAHRTKYDSSIGRGRGFVWIASQGELRPDFPNWKKPYSLRGLALHEWGHTLGTPGHVEGTIMDPDIQRLIDYNPNGPAAEVKLAQARLTRIDFERELYLCEFCNGDLEGEMPKDVEGLFASLMGRPAHGTIHEHFSARSSFIPGFPILTLSLKDDEAEKKFPIKLGQVDNSAMVESPEPVFSISYSLVPKNPNDPTQDIADYQSTRGIVLDAAVMAADGSKIPLTIERNVELYKKDPAPSTEPRMLIIRYRDGENKKILFSPDLPKEIYEPPMK